PSRLHTIDKLTMGSVQNTLPEAGFFVLLRLKGVEKGLVLASGIDTPLHPQLLHCLDKAETGCCNPNGANQTGLVGIDLIGSTGNVVGSRGPKISNHRI